MFANTTKCYHLALFRDLGSAWLLLLAPALVRLPPSGLLRNQLGNKDLLSLLWFWGNFRWYLRTLPHLSWPSSLTSFLCLFAPYIFYRPHGSVKRHSVSNGSSIRRNLIFSNARVATLPVGPAYAIARFFATESNPNPPAPLTTTQKVRLRAWIIPVFLISGETSFFVATQLKRFIRKYGRVGLYTYLAVSALDFALFYTLISAGVDVEAVLIWIGLESTHVRLKSIFSCIVRLLSWFFLRAPLRLLLPWPLLMLCTKSSCRFAFLLWWPSLRSSPRNWI